jgi:hypothetical protein
MSKYPSLLRKLYRHYLPQNLQNKIDLYRGESQVFRPCFQPTKSIFIHIPKAAGTSIARAIYGMNVGHRKVLDYHAVSRKEFEQYFSFSFVRNPWDRVVSAYNFVKQGGTQYVQPLPNPIYQSNIFATFESFVTEWLPYADLTKEDVVFAPQYWYVIDKKGDIAINFIGKIETLADDIALLEQRLNITIEIQQLNKSSRVKNYRDYYNEQTQQIVADIYKKDIELFNYRF